MIYAYVAIILLSETTAISFLKEYSTVRSRKYLLFGLLFYGVVSLFLVQSFALEGMGMVNVLWSAFSIVFVESIGVYKFHERITHTQISGISFALLGVAVLRFYG